MSAGESTYRPEYDLRALLRRVRSGDEDAARELLVGFESEVRLVVRRQLPRLLRSRFDSLDFLQSVWGSFFRRMRSDPSPQEFQDRGHLIAFLARAAKNKVIDEYRRAGCQKNDRNREEPLWQDGSPRELVGSDETPSQVAEANEALRQLRALLPKERQEILDLKAGGHTNREIGERLGVSERTIQRVIEDLRRRASSVGDAV